MAISPTDNRIIFTNYDNIAYFLNLVFGQNILLVYNIEYWQLLIWTKNNQSERLYAFKESGLEITDL